VDPFAPSRRVPQSPARGGGMIQAQPSLGHQLLEVTVPEGISQIPPNAQNKDVVPEMAASEQLWSGFMRRFSPIKPRFKLFATEPNG
jgi:hypothetical protein